MIPYYATQPQECEYCESTIYIGYEAVLTDDGLFCSKDCLLEHLYEMSNAKEVYLTDDRIYMDVD